jgi:hypothetical protein
MHACCVEKGKWKIKAQSLLKPCPGINYTSQLRIE